MWFNGEWFGGNVNWLGLLALIAGIALLVLWGFRDEKRQRCVHWDWDGNNKPCPHHYDDGSHKPALEDW